MQSVPSSFRVSADVQHWEAKQGATGEPNSHETRSGVPSQAKRQRIQVSLSTANSRFDGW